MIVLGVTGCVGAGKSTLCAMLRDAGWVVLDVDHEAAAVVLEPGVQAALRELLGPTARLSPSAVLSRIVSNPEQRGAIEAFVLPGVHARIAAWRAALSTPGVIDSAMLFEGALDEFCDATLCLTCDARVRRERVLQRATVSAALFDAIDASQLPEPEKARRAAFRVASDVPLGEMRAALDAVLAEL